jgi:peptidoglycan/LPS O-acetylase OafA/YrhL
MGTRIVAGAAQELLLSALALVVSLICAWIFFKLVERPSTELARLFARRPGSSNLVAN